MGDIGLVSGGRAVWSGVVVGIDDGQTNGINFIQFVCPSRTPIRGDADVFLRDRRRTDEWNKFYPIRLSVSNTDPRRR